MPQPSFQNPTKLILNSSLDLSLDLSLILILDLIETKIRRSKHLMNDQEFIFYQQNDTNLCAFCTILNAFQIQNLNQLKKYLSNTDKAYQQELAICLENSIKNGIQNTADANTIRRLVSLLKKYQQKFIKKQFIKKIINKAYFIYMLDVHNKPQHALCGLQIKNKINIKNKDNIKKICLIFDSDEDVILDFKLSIHQLKNINNNINKKWMGNNINLKLERVY